MEDAEDEADGALQVLRSDGKLQDDLSLLLSGGSGCVQVDESTKPEEKLLMGDVSPISQALSATGAETVSQLVLTV